MKEGCYYYDPKRHSLAGLGESRSVPAEAYDFYVNRPVFERASVAIYLIAQMAAIEPMYGEKSREFGLIEAGGIAQMLTMAAVQRGLGVCGIGNVDESYLREPFDLSGSHVLLYSMLVGLTDLEEGRSPLGSYFDGQAKSSASTSEVGEI